MSVKFLGINDEKKELIVEIDVANTKNIGATLEVIDIMAAKNGLLPHIIKRNFPIFNKHKGFTDQQQFDILDLINEKTNLERKVARDKLQTIKTNSANPTWLKPEVETQLIEIVERERNQNRNNFMKKAQKSCVEHLTSIDKDDGKRLDDMSPKSFAQYISRISKKNNFKKII